MSYEPPDLAQEVRKLTETNHALGRERDELYRLNEELRTGYMELRYQVGIMVRITAEAIRERNQAMNGDRKHGNENPS